MAFQFTENDQIMRYNTAVPIWNGVLNRPGHVKARFDQILERVVVAQMGCCDFCERRGKGVACQELRCVLLHSSMVETGLAPRPATCYPRLPQQYGAAGTTAPKIFFIAQQLYTTHFAHTERYGGFADR